MKNRILAANQDFQVTFITAQAQVFITPISKKQT